MGLPFHWDHVELNLYRADLPWVMKIRSGGFLAAEIFVYVDDGRMVAFSPDLAWRAACAYVSCCSMLGVQDASRKRTSPSETPEPWAGMVTHTDGGQVCGMVSQEKWEKTKVMIMELSRMVEKDFFPLQRLLVIRGFLIYVVRTYPWLNPYIKGLYLTIDLWRPGREESGFKMRGKELERALAAWAEGRGLPCRREDDDTDEVAPLPPREARKSQGHPEDEAPGDVRPVPRFRRDVACLLELTESRKPPKQLHRAKRVMAFFVIGDASG